MNFKEECLKLNINITEEMENLFSIYFDTLIETNKVMNLTNITEKDEAYNKHFLDSLYLTKALDKKEYTLCDVGSGAGFPALPLAITNPKANITIIDSLNKRINFLNNTISLLNINNIRAIAKRAEDAKEYRETFDYVTARAVARLNILLELCMPLVKVGGSFIAMKSLLAKEELEESKNAIKKLGGELKEVIEYDLPDNAGSRSLIVIKKISQTPNAYPRLFKKIKERPL